MTEEFENLANAVILQAVKDWRWAVKVLKKRSRYLPAREMREDCEKFFRSEWFGQLTGIGRMLEENRYCGDVLTQIAAVESALTAFGYIVLQEHLETCVADDLRSGNDESMEEVMGLIRKLK